MSLQVEKGFQKLTAAEWLTWTVVHSLYALTDVLPDGHMRVWRIFVRAVSLICVRLCKKSMVHEADGLLMEYCEEFADKYGEDRVVSH